MSEINDADDLRGMLPYEIIAVVKQLEAERDVATARAEAAEARFVFLRRRLLVGSGKACKVCLGCWGDEETADDHHDWCPLGILMRGALLGPVAPTTGREGE